jgi:hypothetical protein
MPHPVIDGKSDQAETSLFGGISGKNVRFLTAATHASRGCPRTLSEPVHRVFKPQIWAVAGEEIRSADFDSSRRA